MESWLSDIAALDGAELDALVAELSAEEQEISYQRRVLHGKFDLLRAELVNRLREQHGSGEREFGDAEIAGLAKLVLGEEEEPSTSIAGSDAGGEPAIEPPDAIVPPDLGALDDAALKDLIAQLAKDERRISYQRRILQGRIDILRAEIGSRGSSSTGESKPAVSGDDVEQLSQILSGKPADELEG